MGLLSEMLSVIYLTSAEIHATKSPSDVYVVLLLTIGFLKNVVALSWDLVALCGEKERGRRSPKSESEIAA